MTKEIIFLSSKEGQQGGFWTIENIKRAIKTIFKLVGSTSKSLTKNHNIQILYLYIAQTKNIMIRKGMWIQLISNSWLDLQILKSLN